MNPFRLAVGPSHPNEIPKLSMFAAYTLWLFNIAMEAMAHRNR
jgi:hypothetical protein